MNRRKAAARTTGEFYDTEYVRGRFGPEGLGSGRLTDVPRRSLLAFAAAAFFGGLIAAGLGSRKLATVNIRRLLADVPVVAGVKMLFA